jgi:glycosyltransferase involved in cell wall biosynthesis
MLLIGEGGDRAWLARNLEHADLPGILRGDALADAFADMDAFVFPSHTDTFGLVLLEAMASGVPVVLSPDAGARVGVRDGVTGFFAHDADGFAQAILRLMNNDSLRRRMSAAAREFACAQSWSGVFERVYEIYREGLSVPRP